MVSGSLVTEEVFVVIILWLARQDVEEAESEDVSDLGEGVSELGEDVSELGEGQNTEVTCHHHQPGREEGSEQRAGRRRGPGTWSLSHCFINPLTVLDVRAPADWVPGLS